MTDTQAFASMYERIGGAVTIDHLVESFYRRMDALPEAQIVRAMHPADLDSAKRALKHYLTEWMGGPKLYTPEKGHPRLRQRHFGFPIGSAERDAWPTCMRGALQETVLDDAARADLDLALSRLADWMRN